MKSRIEKLFSRPYIPACFLLVLGLAAFGRLIIQGGTYGDDPQMLYAFHRYGLAGYQYSLGWSRPFGMWVHTPLYILFGDHLRLWQFSAILLRIFSAWLLFTLLCEVKEEWRLPALWTAAACLLYPGFSQQAHALQFSLHWAALSASLGSQILMLRVLEESEAKHHRVLMAFSILLAILGIFSTEYFIGLELLRFMILWIYIADKKRSIDFDTQQKNVGQFLSQRISFNAFLSALYHWLPYLVPVMIFSVWRVFFAQIQYPSPLLLDDLKANPGEAISSIFTRIPIDMQLSGVFAWRNAIQHKPYYLEHWLYFGLGITAAILIGFIVWRYALTTKLVKSKDAIVMIAIGLVLTLVSGLPLWIAKIPLALSFPENRATLCLMVGVCLTLAGLASLIRQPGHVLMAILLGFSLVFQIDILLVYENSWQRLQTFFNQLTTCAPGLEPGTTLLYEEPFILSYPANSLSVLLNWTYDTDNHSGYISYDVLRVSERLGSGIPALEPNLPIQHGAFRGNTSQVLVVTVDKQGCPQFLFPDDEKLENYPSILRQASRISNPAVIISDPIQPAQLPDFIQALLPDFECSCD